MADGAPVGVEGASGGGTQKALELGEDLLHRVQVGTVGRQVEERGAADLDGGAHALDLVGAEVIHDHDAAGPGGGARACSTEARRRTPVMAPSNTEGAVIPSWRSAATRRWARRARPWRLAMLVVAQVSSRNTGRSGLQRGLLRTPGVRAAATSGRSCSAAWRVFFSRQPVRDKKAPERRAARADAAGGEPGAQFLDGQVRQPATNASTCSAVASSGERYQPPYRSGVTLACRRQRCISLTTKLTLTSNLAAVTAVRGAWRPTSKDWRPGEPGRI